MGHPNTERNHVHHFHHGPNLLIQSVLHVLLYGTSLQGSQMDSIEIAAEFLFVFVVFQGGVLVHGISFMNQRNNFGEHSEHVIGRRFQSLGFGWGDSLRILSW